MAETFTQRATPTAAVLVVVSAALWVVAAASTATAMVAAASKSEPSQCRRRVATFLSLLNVTLWTARPGIVVVNVKWEGAAAAV